MASVPVPSAEEVRRLLGERFPRTETLDRFCLDHFPEVQREFAAAMDRTTRENLLLTEVGVERVWCALEGRRSPSGPSALPPNNLPVRNATFVGRGPQLDALHRALTAEGVASVVPQQVFGLGGVGKTSLALEYAYRHADDYPGGLWWVRAEGKPEDALVAFADQLRLIAPEPVRHPLERVPENAPSAVVAQAVKLALQNHTLPSLLVLDNVSAQGWIAHIPSGAVRTLVTTRDRSLLRNVPAVLLESLSDEEACELAQRIAGPMHSELETAARNRVLHTVLGNLTVAVEIAARGVVEWGTPWSEYETLLASQPTRVLEAEDARGDYPLGVIAALELSIERTGTGTPARKLLEGAAVFAPDAIPREWAAVAAGFDDDLSVRRATAALQALGLLRTSARADCFDLHRLVRLTVRGLTALAKNGEWQASQRRALHCARDWMEATVDISRIAVVEARRPHVEELVESTQSVDERAWSALTNSLATHLRHRAERESARRLFERALLADEAALGPDHPTVAVRLSNLATVLRDLGEAAAAKLLLERAIAIHELNVGPSHPDVAVCLSNLATVHQDLGDAATAKVLLERALNIDEASFGPDHPSVGLRLSNLAMVLKSLHDPASAKPLLERALRIGEATLGPDHPSVATRLSNLATVYQDLGDPASAKPLLERALLIHEAALGPSHPAVGVRLSNLALVHQDLGDVATAKALLERAVAILDALLGPDHPNTRAVRANLQNLRTA